MAGQIPQPESGSCLAVSLWSLGATCLTGSHKWMQAVMVSFRECRGEIKGVLLRGTCCTPNTTSRVSISKYASERRFEVQVTEMFLPAARKPEVTFSSDSPCPITMCVGVCLRALCMPTTCVPSACLGQTGDESPLKLELWMVVSNHGCWEPRSSVEATSVLDS